MASFNFPNSPSDGQVHTENGVSFVWNNTNGAWKKNPGSLTKGDKGDIAGTPVGQIVAWSGYIGALPAGYLFCNGAAISRTTYSVLFNIIGVSHGSGDGSSTFNIPDLRDRFVVGAHADGSDTTYPELQPSATGGQADAIIPNHTHPTSIDNQHVIPGGGGSTYSYGGAGTYISKIFTMSNPTNGEAVTNKNLPPYYALAYIIQYSQGGDPAKGQKGVKGVEGPVGPGGASVKGQKGVEGPTGPAGSASNYQAFTTSGTWTKPATGNMCNVYMWGGGGGGGGNSAYNGGGGGGGYAEYQIPMSTLASTVSVTVGAGGGVNSNGGSSEFGSSAYAVYGGNAGHNSTNYNTGGYGGNGGGPLGTGTGAARGFYGSSTTDDGTQDYYNVGASSGKDGHSGGGGGSAAGGGNNSNASAGGGAYMAGGGGGSRRGTTNRSGGASQGGGNGGTALSDGTAPAGGGGARNSGARGEVRVVVV